MRKPLFCIIDEPVVEAPYKVSSACLTLKEYQLCFKENALLELQNLGKLQQHTVIKFKSEGSWSTHELLAYLLQQVGPSDVYLSTWTMSEDPARVLFQLKEKGLIKSLTCLLDYRIHIRAGEAFQLISSIADTVKLTKCHAKVFVLLNETWGISVVGSANFSKNRRIEAGTIFIDREAACFDKAWMEKAHDNT